MTGLVAGVDVGGTFTDLVILDRAAILQQQQPLRDRLLVPVFADADGFTVVPIFLIVKGIILERFDLRTRPTPLILNCADLVRDDPIRRIALDRVGRGRIGIQAERIAQRLYPNVLRERSIVAVIHAYPPRARAGG